MISKLIDAVRQKGDLDIGAAGVFFVNLEPLNFFSCCCCHKLGSPSICVFDHLASSFDEKLLREA
jgi:hypothetical protein